MKRKILTLCGVTIIGVTAITFVTRETGGVAAAEDAMASRSSVMASP